MSNKAKLIERLTNQKDGFELVDVKFSLGFDRFISEEAFCGEVLKGLTQVEAGHVTSVSPSSIDGKFRTRTVSELLA